MDAVAFAKQNPGTAARVVVRARRSGGDSANALAVLMDAVGTMPALALVAKAEVEFDA
jgi:hypothetical protein